MGLSSLKYLFRSKKQRDCKRKADEKAKIIETRPGTQLRERRDAPIAGPPSSTDTLVEFTECKPHGVLVVHRRGSACATRKVDYIPDDSQRFLMCLPTEVWSRIVSHIPDVTQFSRASRATHSYLQDPHVRRALLFGKYGVRLSLYLSYMHHRRLLTPELVKLLLRGGARIPRFMIQTIARQFQGIPTENLPALERCLLAEGQQYYGSSVDFCADDDVLAFEYLTNDLINNFAAIRALITRYHFVPLESVTPTATFRLSQLLQADISLLDTLIHSNGLSPSLINDALISHLLTSSKSNHRCLNTMLPCYLTRGFTLTRSVILTQLRGHPSDVILQVLQKHVPPNLLLACATQVLSEIFGPSVSSFDPEVVTRIIAFVRVSDPIFSTFLFHPVSALPYRTRCYEQPNPIPVWRWIVDHFGPAHTFSTRAFTDLLVWTNDSNKRRASGDRRRPPVHRSRSVGVTHRLSSDNSASSQLSRDARRRSQLRWNQDKNNPLENIEVDFERKEAATVILEFMAKGCKLEPRHFASPNYTPSSSTVPLLFLPPAVVIRQISLFRETPPRNRAEWINTLSSVVDEVRRNPKDEDPYTDAVRNLKDVLVLSRRPDDLSIGLPVTTRARTWDVGTNFEGKTWAWLRGKW
ncbi:hypothetical protein DFJ77DRAFT_261001 [Powellomyces hirtus]|nr:hypothetical protein DFJ77DRAFT_261001 [Powellomyces hirtus]